MALFSFTAENADASGFSDERKERIERKLADAGTQAPNVVLNNDPTSGRPGYVQARFAIEAASDADALNEAKRILVSLGEGSWEIIAEVGRDTPSFS